MLAESKKRQLDELGYLVLPGFVPPARLAAIRERVETLWKLEGDNAGSEFRPEPGTRRHRAAACGLAATLAALPLLRSLWHLV